MPSSKKSTHRRAKPHSKGPSEIAPGVFVGGWNDALRFEGARFCVLDEAPDDMPPATHVPIYNGTAERADVRGLNRVAGSMQAARAKGASVLVFCGHGVRRAPLAGAWYLRRTEDLSLDEAYDRVRSVRPKIEHAREWVGNAGELERA
jgi:protein-tyrosine phosphatase